LLLPGHDRQMREYFRDCSGFHIDWDVPGALSQVRVRLLELLEKVLLPLPWL
jgi:hypothetical protein